MNFRLFEKNLKFEKMQQKEARTNHEYLQIFEGFAPNLQPKLQVMPIGLFVKRIFERNLRFLAVFEKKGLFSQFYYFESMQGGPGASRVGRGKHVEQ